MPGSKEGDSQQPAEGKHDADIDHTIDHHGPLRLTPFSHLADLQVKAQRLRQASIVASEHPIVEAAVYEARLCCGATRKWPESRKGTVGERVVDGRLPKICDWTGAKECTNQ